MRSLVLHALACSLASPAIAQDAHHGHADNAASADTPPMADREADHSSMDHGSMDHSMEKTESTPPTPDKPMDHSMHMGRAAEPERPADDMPGNAPPPSIPADRAADAYFPPERMGRSVQGLMDEMTFSTLALQIDQLEYRALPGKDGYGFEGQAWYGGDIDRAVVAFEGEGSFDEAAESIEIDGYWRHALDPWFNLQLGVRHDFRPGPDRTYAMLGIQGLAPYWFEVQGQMFVSDKGDVHARATASYNLRITQRLILEPEVEADLVFQEVPELRIGAGVEKVELSARLRYEVTPMFAPYLGVLWERKLGATADYARAEGEKASAVSTVGGIRIWF